MHPLTAITFIVLILCTTSYCTAPEHYDYRYNTKPIAFDCTFVPDHCQKLVYMKRSRKLLTKGLFDGSSYTTLIEKQGAY